MTRKEHLEALLANIQFADPMPYKLHVIADPELIGNHAEREFRGMVKIFIQASYMDKDTYTGEEEEQWTRRWHIANDATDSQVVQTAFKMCLTSAEHRVREAFQYKGVRIFGPHFDVEDLVKLGSGKGQWAGAPAKDFVWK